MFRRLLPFSVLLLVLSTAALADEYSPTEVAKLVRLLGDDTFKVREDVTEKLVKFGPAVPPAPRMAHAADTDLEIKRRLKLIIDRIVSAIAREEDGRWKGLDAPRRAVRDRLAVTDARSPGATDRKMTAAVYLLAVGRAPTEAEAAQGEKRLAEGTFRLGNAQALARSLVSGKEYASAMAGVNERILKTQREVAAVADGTKALHRLNSDEARKLIDAASAAADKAAKRDEDLID